MKKLLSLTLSISILFNVSAQKLRMEEGRALLRSYISPLTISLGTALNNGWYNTAKPHKLGGFDVTFTANFVLIPDEAKTFNITEQGFTYFTGGETATIFGEDGGEITYTDGGGEESSTMPPGLAIPIIPIPMLQAGIGLIKGSEINIRYFPKKEISAGEVSLFGIGVKHDVLQWLPIVDKIPLTVSVQAGYTQLDYKKKPILDGRTAELNLSATTFNLILSKKLLMFTPYVGVGYNSTGSSFIIDDFFRIGGTTPSMSPNFDFDEVEEVELESYNEPRINVGFRFNITVLALQANYTFSKYPVATLGAGISLR